MGNAIAKPMPHRVDAANVVTRFTWAHAPGGAGAAPNLRDQGRLTVAA
jgi:hypothetical protein